MRLPRFRPGAPWRPWLLRIVANEARNRRRAEGRRRALALRAAAAADAPGEPAAGPDVLVLLQARRSALADALARLPSPFREVVVLRHLLELTESECAAVLDVPVGTVKSRRRSAAARGTP